MADQATDVTIRARYKDLGVRGGLSGIMHALGGVSRTLMTIVGIGSIAAMTKGFLNASNTAEQYRTRLEVLLRSQSEANRLFQEMSIYASRVPHTYESIMESATRLSGVMSGGVDEVAKWMPLIGDLAAAVGMSIEDTTGQVVRMYSAGAAAADMFRERGVLGMLGFKAGVTYTAQETREQMMREWQKMDSQFRGATDKLAGTWTGLMSMFGDAWFEFRNTFMDAGLFDYLKAVATGTLEWVQANKTLISVKVATWGRQVRDIVRSLVDFFRSYGDIIGKIFVIATITLVVTKIAALTSKVVALAGAVRLLGTSVLTYKNILVALGVVAGYMLWDRLTGGQDDLENKIEQNRESLIGMIQDMKMFGMTFEEGWRMISTDFDLGITTSLERYGMSMSVLRKHVMELWGVVEEAPVKPVEEMKKSWEEMKKALDELLNRADSLESLYGLIGSGILPKDFEEQIRTQIPRVLEEIKKQIDLLAESPSSEGHLEYLDKLTRQYMSLSQVGGNGLDELIKKSSTLAALSKKVGKGLFTDETEVAILAEKEMLIGQITARMREMESLPVNEERLEYIRALAQAYEDLTEKLEKSFAQLWAEADGFRAKLEVAGQVIEENLGKPADMAIQSIIEVINNAGEAFTDFFHDIIADSKMAMSNLGANMIEILADVAKAWGKYFFLHGTAMLFIGHPGAGGMIAAGLGLMALGGVASGIATNLRKRSESDLRAEQERREELRAGVARPADEKPRQVEVTVNVQDNGALDSRGRREVQKIILNGIRGLQDQGQLRGALAR